jgi:hypothetical protein
MKPLKGSEKQVEWAEKIRVNFFLSKDNKPAYYDGMSDKAKVLEHSLETFKSIANREFKEETTLEEDGFKFQLLWDKFISFIQSQDEAKFWIDNRSELERGAAAVFSYLMVLLSLSVEGSKNVPKYGLYADLLKVITK